MEPQHILWLDLETTGLDPKKCHILEVAAVVTDMSLNELDSLSLVISQPGERLTLEAMGEWCFNQHMGSGLVDKCLLSQVYLLHAEDRILSLPLGSKPYLAGNSIHFDRSFLREHMPTLLSKLHHRQIDVSTLNVLAEAWGRNDLKLPKAEKHRALDDIRESIAQAAKYAVELF